MTLKELVEQAHAMSRSKGWYDGEDATRNIPEMLALIHSEVSEALEDYRAGHDTDQTFYNCGICYGSKGYGNRAVVEQCNRPHKPVGFPTELADVVIRIGDLCGYLGIDLEAAVTEKMTYNATRPYRHGGKVA